MRAWLATLLVGLLLALPARADDAVRLAIVVNPKSPVQSLAVDDARDLFTAQRQFWDGSVRVTLVMQAKDAPAHALLLAKVLHMSADDLERAILQKRYRGVLIAEVKIVATAAEARAAVAESPRAIGYLLESDVDASVRVVLRR